ncbi:hypothetical protein ACHAW6_012024 [Cyclotella cf. meneghiniana]
MYMARSFMIHAALNWGEDGSDNISLWLFAVDYAVSLYNHIPQSGSGIMPLEMVPQNKSDHRDLMRAHAWGCPVYVLEASLQDEKKLPKWNRRAWMGQFLCFSQEHSSTVAWSGTFTRDMSVRNIILFLMISSKLCLTMASLWRRLIKLATSCLSTVMIVMLRRSMMMMVC